MIVELNCHKQLYCANNKLPHILQFKTKHTFIILAFIGQDSRRSLLQCIIKLQSRYWLHFHLEAWLEKNTLSSSVRFLGDFIPLWLYDWESQLKAVSRTQKAPTIPHHVTSLWEVYNMAVCFSKACRRVSPVCLERALHKRT